MGDVAACVFSGNAAAEDDCVAQIAVSASPANQIRLTGETGRFVRILPPAGDCCDVGLPIGFRVGNLIFIRNLGTLLAERIHVRFDNGFESTIEASQIGIYHLDDKNEWLHAAGLATF